MTDQEAFTRMVQWLRTQGGPSMEATSSVSVCYYRHPDGIRRCAIGILISDESYKPEMEGKAVHSLCFDGRLRVSEFQGLSYELLRDMQQAHDGNYIVPGVNLDYTYWREAMEMAYVHIASTYGLKVPVHPLAQEVIQPVMEAVEG